MINVTADTHYIGGFVVTESDTWLAMGTDGEWEFTKDYDQRWVFETDKAAHQVVSGFTRVETDAAFDNGYAVVKGDRYLARHSSGDWMFTRIWARRWVFGSEQEAKGVMEGSKERQTLWVHYNTPAAEWCLIDDEEQGWVFETHHEALEVLGTLADPYLVIVPIVPAQKTKEMYDQEVV